MRSIIRKNPFRRIRKTQEPRLEPEAYREPEAPQEPEALRGMRKLLDENDLKIELRYAHPVRVHASIKDTEFKETKDSGVLTSISSSGKSGEDALRNLAQAIRSKRLVYRAYSQHGRREVDVPDFPEDSDRRPWENEIIFQPPEKRRAGKTRHACSYCMKDLESGEPSWKIANTQHRICRECVDGHHIFIGEPRSREEIQAE